MPGWLRLGASHACVRGGSVARGHSVPPRRAVVPAGRAGAAAAGPRGGGSAASHTIGAARRQPCSC
eukprot:99216-Alexandrium_andersonii.AAC.1